MRPIITENLIKPPTALHQVSDKIFFICTEYILVQTEQHGGILLFVHLQYACPLDYSTP